MEESRGPGGLAGSLAGSPSLQGFWVLVGAVRWVRLLRCALRRLVPSQCGWFVCVRGVLRADGLLGRCSAPLGVYEQFYARRSGAFGP